MSQTARPKNRRTDSKANFAPTYLRSSRRKPLLLERLEERCLLSSLPLSPPLAHSDAAIQAHASAGYGHLPLSFEANSGQTDEQVDYLSRGKGYKLFLTASEA